MKYDVIILELVGLQKPTRKEFRKGDVIMSHKYEHLRDIDAKIKLLEKTAQELVALCEEQEIPAVERNAKRILASTKMLKLDISDILDFQI